MAFAGRLPATLLGASARPVPAPEQFFKYSKPLLLACAVSMLASPKARRKKDLSEHITGGYATEGDLRPQKHPRRVQSLGNRHIQLPQSSRDPEHSQPWLDGEPHLANDDDDDDAPQEADDHHFQIDDSLEEGVVRSEDLTQSREAQQRDRDQQWQEKREVLYEQYVAGLVSNIDLVSAMKDAIQSGVQAAVTAAASSCPSCFQSHQLTQQAIQPILWLGANFRFDLEVPFQMCLGCGIRYSPKPLEAGCMPATPVHSWDVSKAPHGSRLIWFDLSLVKVRMLMPSALVAQAIGGLYHHDMDVAVLPFCELKIMALQCRRWMSSFVSSKGCLWTG